MKDIIYHPKFRLDPDIHYEEIPGLFEKIDKYLDQNDSEVICSWDVSGVDGVPDTVKEYQGDGWFMVDWSFDNEDIECFDYAIEFECECEHIKGFITYDSRRSNEFRLWGPKVADEVQRLILDELMKNDQ